MRKWTRYLGVLSAVALITAACAEEGGGGGGGGDGAVDKIPVSVYFQGALTGDFNYLVIHCFQAAQLAFDELNADPNFPAEVTLEQADTQGDPEQAPPVVEEVITDPDTVAVLGPAFSGESEASNDDYNTAGIPTVTPEATNPGLADPGHEYWFRTIANDDDQGTPAGQYIVQNLGAQNVYVVHDQSTYGQGLAEVVADTVESEGAKVAAVEGIEATEDYSSLISDIEASGADAIFYGGYDAQTGLIVQQAREAGVDAPIVSGDGSVSNTLIDLAGDALSDVHLTCPCNLEGQGEFLTKYEAEYGESGVPVYAAEGYDAANLVGEGIRSAIEGGATEIQEIRDGIKEYLEGLTPEAPYEGIAKTYAFDESHELAAESRTDLIFFYEASPDGLALLGNATDVVGAA
ncbi:MAG: branched-chain amino acid ABC transporter substrate-binding protein [Actinomycetota bacterium]|nr:branched-chain amino acid ABC transporter substrate-binding protein [Actinomycetota bacterium]